MRQTTGPYICSVLRVLQLTAQLNSNKVLNAHVLQENARERCCFEVEGNVEREFCLEAVEMQT